MGDGKCLYTSISSNHVWNNLDYTGGCNLARLKHLRRYITRWHLLTIWIVVFTIVVYGITKHDRRQIQELKDQKANIGLLQKTNCKLKKYLITSEKFRLRTAQKETGLKQKADLQAAATAAELANSFSNPSCLKPAPLPKLKVATKERNGN